MAVVFFHVWVCVFCLVYVFRVLCMCLCFVFVFNDIKKKYETI